MLEDSDTDITCCENVQEPTTCNQMRCPLGKYCNAVAGQGTCQEVTAVGSACTGDLQCGYKAFCDLSAEEPTCMLDGTLANGGMIGAAYLPDKCASGVVVDNRETDAVDPDWMCVKGAVMADNSSIGTSFSEQSDCHFTNFTTADENAEGTPGTTPALCGFNEKANYYCPVFRGDPYYNDWWTEYVGYLKSATANSQCNINSAGMGAGPNTVGCAALQKAIGNETFWDLQMLWRCYLH